MTTTDPSDSWSDLGLSMCLYLNICLCVSPSCSPQHCLSRTSPCTWQCLCPILTPCINQEGVWAARPWQQPQPPWVTAGCCPLHRPLCTGTWAPAEAPRGPPVREVQVSGKSKRFDLVHYRIVFVLHLVKDVSIACTNGIIRITSRKIKWKWFNPILL